MSRSTWLLLTVFTLLIMAAWTEHKDGGTCDQAEEHGNFTLTCYITVKNDVSAAQLYIKIRSVNLGRWIYRYVSWSEAEPYQDELYKDRVCCDLELAKRGNISCVITDLRLNDTDTYEVYVFLNGVRKDTTVNLNVTETIENVTTPASGLNHEGFWPILSPLIPGLVVLVLVILGAGVAGYLLKHKCQKQNDPEYEAAPTSSIV